MLHCLSTLADSIASICLEASTRSVGSGFPLAVGSGQTNTSPGAVAVPSLPPRPGRKPESVNPLFEIARPSCANSAQVKFRYSFVGQDADKPAAAPLVQFRAVAANIMMPRKRM